MPHIASCSYLHASFNPWTQTRGFLFNLGSQSCGDGRIKSWLQGDFFGRWRRGWSSIVSFLSSKLLYWIGKLLWGRWRGRKHRYSRQHTFIVGEEKIYILETTFMLEMQPPIWSNLVCQRKRKHRNACFAECISREGRQQRLMVGAWKAIWVRAFIPPHFSFDFNNGSKLKTKTQK